ncbi:MAG: M1 family metallopeptidase [Acidobacteriota bacterium]
MRRHFWFAVALALVAATSGLSARQAPSRSPRNASYTLTATLDPVNRQLYGSGRLRWQNTSHVEATELRFHTYWNAWRDEHSTWMREQRLSGYDPLERRADDDRGSIDVTTLALVTAAGSENLLPQARFVAPDDGNGEDRTVLLVPLPRPVAPGATIDIDLGWNAHVPRTFARAGAIGNYFFIAQWFPKIGVLEDSGWNCHQFHAATEFFADFGLYDVSMTVPTGWVVGATGREQSVADNGNGTATHRYVESDVHDFAWTTSPSFKDLHVRFEEPGFQTVDIRLLLQPEHQSQADRHFAAARAALKYFSTWFGPYPYDHLTIVDPVTIVNARAQGNSSGGMEYPTLITAGTNWSQPWASVDLENVVVHETGHQFWYGVVATNEFENAWMDEGVNSFATARVLAEAFPARFVRVRRYLGGLITWKYQDVRWSRDGVGNGLNSYRLDPSRDVQSTPTWKYWPGAAAFVTTYDKTALWMATLERRLGPATMEKVLATYYARNAFAHPLPATFFAIASEVSGEDLTWFADAVYRSASTFDYSLEQVSDQPAGNGSTDSTVVVRRRADGVFPVDVRVTFDDGSAVTERWDGRDTWRAFHYRRAAHVLTAAVDPDRTLLLDLNYTNNSWTSQSRAAEASRKWSLRWLTWFEHVLMTYAFFT